MQPAKPQYRFRKEERPAVPGGAYTPWHPLSRRAGYAFTALILSVLSTFGNGLVGDNLNYVAGGYGCDSAEAIWLNIAYTGMSASASLFVVKGRQQIGIEPIVQTLLSIYILAAAVELLFPSFATALVARCLNGLATSTGVAMATYMLLQVFPKKLQAAAVPIILGGAQLGPPLARLVPVELLVRNGNFGLHLINLAVPAVELALILIWPLPPALTAKVLSRLDILTVALLLPALVLLVGVLALGRTLWWTDTPWLGWMLAGAVLLAALGLVVELNRSRPTLWIKWMLRGDVLRFVIIAFVERIAVAEQSTGAVGLMSSAAGLNDDQLHGLFIAVIAAMVLGIVTAAGLLSIKAIPWMVTVALIMIAVGAGLDSLSNASTRPQDLLLSQAMIGFGTTLFVGPALLFGITRVLSSGPQYLVTMIMLFSFTQNIGSLAGSALIGSMQYVYSREASTVLSEDLRALDPQVQQQVEANAGLVAEAENQQANTIGYLDAFRVVALIAALSGAIVLVLIAAMALSQPRKTAGAR